MVKKQVDILFYFSTLLGQAYIMSLKNGDNSIIIVGGSNAAFDPNMKELDKDWEQTIKKSDFIIG